MISIIIDTNDDNELNIGDIQYKAQLNGIEDAKRRFSTSIRLLIHDGSGFRDLTEYMSEFGDLKTNLETKEAHARLVNRIGDVKFSKRSNTNEVQIEAVIRLI